MVKAIRTSCVLAMVLLVAGCGGSGAPHVASAPPAPVGKGACLLARSTALDILARALHGSGPIGARLRSAERRAAVTLRRAARQISALETAAGSAAKPPLLAPALAGSARQLSYLAGRVHSAVPADALAQYSAAGQMVYDACA
jgi:hypothetical protein